MTSREAAVRPINRAFEGTTVELRVDAIQPLHLIPKGAKSSPKYKQIVSSIQEVGLVEPPVVARNKDDDGTFILLDGHLRIEALKQLGISTVDCLVATDDEAFTYNKRVSRIAIIQEHLMILKSIERGVSEEKIAKTLNVNVGQIRLKRHLLKGICTEVVELLKDRFVPMNTFAELRRMVPLRQIEAAELMIAMNKFSLNYAKSLVGATPQSQLLDGGPKKVSGLTDTQMGMMEQESASLDREFRLIEESYGADNLDLVVATGYVERLLDNARVVRYLAQKHPELLSEFQKMAAPAPVPA